MKPQLAVLLEDIRSAYNVGSIFRCCDGAGIDTLYLTGRCAHPPHSKLEKTALGSTTTVKWEYHLDINPVIDKLKQANYQIICLETGPTSQNLFDISIKANTCLVFGNEVDGISTPVLDQADQIVAIPMLGQKSSLNVATSAAIAIYECKRQIGFKI